MIRLVLPYPISANRYWQSFVPKGATRAIVHLSTEAKKYKKLVGQHALEAGIRTALACPVEVTLELYPHRPLDWAKRAKLDPVWWDLTVMCIDLDNAQKVLWDSLKGIVFTDDKMIRKSAAEIMWPDEGNERVVVTIKPYVRTHPQLALIETPPTFVRVESAVETYVKSSRERARPDGNPF
jgi:crossover junction endodeoxyribonuclease RusA